MGGYNTTEILGGCWPVGELAAIGSLGMATPRAAPIGQPPCGRSFGRAGGANGEVASRAALDRKRFNREPCSMPRPIRRSATTTAGVLPVTAGEDGVGGWTEKVGGKKKERVRSALPEWTWVRAVSSDTPALSPPG